MAGGGGGLKVQKAKIIKLELFWKYICQQTPKQQAL